MAHIQLPEDLPGIRGLMVFRPETAEPLNQLADLLLRGPNTLSPGDRELIATFVSSRNDCFFCRAFTEPWPHTIWAITNSWCSTSSATRNTLPYRTR
jgi:alkylhydroperoxidase family enzyme